MPENSNKESRKMTTNPEQVCADCEGTGRLQYVVNAKPECPTCHGTGRVAAKPHVYNVDTSHTGIHESAAPAPVDQPDELERIIDVGGAKPKQHIVAELRALIASEREAAAKEARIELLSAALHAEKASFLPHNHNHDRTRSWPIISEPVVILTEAALAALTKGETT